MQMIALCCPARSAVPFLVQMARVFIVMTVDTEQLPVASVRRIVVVVVVPVMDREFTKFFAFKFATASPADPGKKLERFLPITLFPLLAITPGFGNNLVHFFLIHLIFLQIYRLLCEK